jgi:hypothetical protein
MKRWLTPTLELPLGFVQHGICVQPLCQWLGLPVAYATVGGQHKIQNG